MRLRPARSPTLVALLALAPFLGCGPEPEPADADLRDRAAAAVGPPAVASDAEEGPLVVFLGDSLSAGLHVDAGAAFPALLWKRLARDGLPFRLVNAGVSGDTTAGGLSRLDWLLAQEPDHVVVELGGNDGLRGVRLDAIEANLCAIVERVRASGASVLLLGTKLPPNYGETYTRGFEAVFRRVAEAYELPFVPFFLEGVGGVPALNFEDGIHPNEEGHRRIADYLEPVLKRWLAAP